VVQADGLPDGYGCDTRLILPIGEQAHGAYSVITMDFVTR
jgi:hypothetical protein